MPEQTPKPVTPDYTTVTYKGIVFQVRKNFIGVGGDICALINKHDDSMVLEPLWLMRLPEFKDYSLCVHNCRIIMNDIREMEAKLKATKDTKLAKTLKANIAKGYEDFKKESSILDSPAVAAVAARYTAIEKQVRFQFVNDPENIKSATETLLIGDLSKIDFETYDEGLVEFRDRLFDVFFYTKSMMQI
jgi:hypothetical protein